VRITIRQGSNNVLTRSFTITVHTPKHHR
jgi:hypothetical protein